MNEWTEMQIRAMDTINLTAADEKRDLNQRYMFNPAMPRNAETIAAFRAESDAIEARRMAAMREVQAQ